MGEIAAAVQNLNPEQKKVCNKKLKEGLAEMVKKLEEEIEKYQEDTHVVYKGRRIRKTLNQCIPATKEEWEEYLRDKKAHENKKQISFIDKVFFADGALDRKNLTNFIDKVFFEDGALQLEKCGKRK